MFGSKDYITPEQAEELIAPLMERIDRLEQQIQTLQQEISSLRLETAVTAATKEASGSKQEISKQVIEPEQPLIGINMDQADAFAPQGAMAGREAQRRSTVYLQAPSGDGLFTLFSEQEQIGKSIYLLTSADGLNGTFILIDSHDAIATAMISVSQFVKPVCKVIGNTRQLPRHIVTEEEGVARKDAGGWRVTRKAVVRFE
ncbi:MAG: hypothetical protein MR450_09295 [Prevotella sp.]|nr:hypothetical protein [Prevotella sp.]MDY4038061.1 hypothetical protein [Prevotella sp.]